VLRIGSKRPILSAVRKSVAAFVYGKRWTIMYMSPALLGICSQHRLKVDSIVTTEVTGNQLLILSSMEVRGFEPLESTPIPRTPSGPIWEHRPLIIGT
jgi:hypothetical protein